MIQKVTTADSKFLLKTCKDEGGRAFSKHMQDKLTAFVGNRGLDVLREVVLRNSAACAFFGYPQQCG